MGSCQIKGGKFYAPNGEESILYENLEKSVGKEQARDLFVLAYTPTFEESMSQAEVDKNGEVTIDNVIDFARQRNENKSPLTFAQQMEVRKMLIEFPEITTSDVLLPRLKRAFYKNGLFSPSRASLTNSGLYTEFEIGNILNDVSLQANIKDSVERLKNTETIDNTAYGISDEYKIKTSEVNSFGKLSFSNPLKLENQTIDEFGGKQEISADLPVNKEQLQEYSRIAKIKEDGSPLTDQIIYDEAVKKVDDPNIVKAVDVLIAAPEVVDTTKLEAKLTNWLYNYGIDIEGFTKDLLPSLRDFILNPIQENIDRFTEKYREVFNKPETQKENVQIIDNKERDYVFLETNKSEQELFDTMNLLKTTQPNIYHRIEKVDFEEMKAALRLPNDILEIDAYKDYFGYPRVADTVDITPNSYGFNGDVNYLTNEFIADFAADKLNNKGNEFYDNFKITEKGIEFVSNDPLTIDTTKAYIKDGIKLGKELEQYSLLSKSLPDLVDIQEDTFLQTREADRVNAVNNPKTVAEFKGDFTRINQDIVVAKNTTSDFIRIDNEVFEIQDKEGNSALYGRLEQNTNLNYFNLTPNAPQEIKIDNLITPTNDFSNIKKKYKKEDLGDSFSCM